MAGIVFHLQLHLVKMYPSSQASAHVSAPCFMTSSPPCFMTPSPPCFTTISPPCFMTTSQPCFQDYITNMCHYYITTMCHNYITTRSWLYNHHVSPLLVPDSSLTILNQSNSLCLTKTCMKRCSELSACADWSMASVSHTRATG